MYKRQLYNQAHGIVEASVTTGVPLEAEQRTRLIDKLSVMTGKRIVLSEKVDPGVVGGVLLGVIEILGKAYVSTELGDALVFAVLIVVLLVKPTGLLGKPVHEKV